MNRITVTPVGLTQPDNPVDGDRLRANLDSIHAALNTVSRHDPDLVVFPELVLHRRDSRNPEIACTVPGPETDELGERARELGAHVVVPMSERDGDRLALDITPGKMTGEDGQVRWVLGVTNAAAGEPAQDAVLRLGPVAAIPAAIQETGFQIRQLVEIIGRAFSGRISVQNTVSGPITIAQAANDFANRGTAWFLNFLALLSISIALINLLPIPVLDGGHLLYYLIELVTGRPLGERAMAAGQYIGLAMIAGLMGLAFYNDILRLMS